VKQWFHEVVVPEFKLEEAKKTGAEERWTATVRVTNAGAGTVPVEIAAARGERFDEKGAPKPDYQEARTRIEIGKGESKDVTIDCPFEPERIDVDPDALVLQLRRNHATIKL
jgi:hypothetical protein